ncbi:NifU family protein [Gemella sp. GH3]|uniref:NifU family protein n=1 Tax=unclassified Gemella TaxID=2624949 RepID=UPI0015CFCDB4|nr:MULTISPECIES: NifU family protein [unclassified Gemella]MBF0714308.1 NifU family protein [Gemella sp. GH3.1]NYS51260.1 NifU family protein [Gemella sp. GH3]
MSKNELYVINKIKFELEKIRPKLQLDNGDIEFINYKDGVLKVRMLGACSTCSVADITMKYAIEDVIKSKIPEIKKVLNVKISIN